MRAIVVVLLRVIRVVSETAISVAETMFLLVFADTHGAVKVRQLIERVPRDLTRILCQFWEAGGARKSVRLLSNRSI